MTMVGDAHMSKSITKELKSMTTEIRVPTTGNAGEDAVVSSIPASVGQQVEAGQVIAILETAKASIDVEAPESGTVVAVRVSEGDEVPEHAVIAIVGQPGEAVDDPEDNPAVDEPTAVAEQTPAPSEVVAEPVTALPGQSQVTETVASPRARILAQRNGIDLSTVVGTGPRGRIIVPDVLQAKKTATPPAWPAVEAPTATDDVVTVPVRGARKITAQRMVQSLQEAAQVTLNRYVAADSLLSFNSRLRAHTESEGLPKISINDMINFAVAQVLPDHPAANSEFFWEGIRQHRQVHLGVAVDTGAALLVPVIRAAHTMSLSELAVATREVVERARSGSFEMADMDGGTFTVTNLGMFEIHWFTPVLNPPQSCILGVGAIHQPTPDLPALLPLSLTFDHRALDGAQAARALAAISGAIENIDVISALAPGTH